MERCGVIIPWTSWLQTGDTSVIEQNWAAMEKYLGAIVAANPDGLWAHGSGIPFGDWLSPEGRTDQVLIATAYWAYDVTLMREMAHATGAGRMNRSTRGCSRRFERRLRRSLCMTTDLWRARIRALHRLEKERRPQTAAEAIRKPDTFWRCI